ncbi:arginine--tRNA ligase [Candidatus Daviesbacteria bacterium RIFCSPHIGHO2_01_FULL_44_29]|uniref:Arginine--tRNA ligase n=1 Tax=Candidatus Daviesbacteria bacterium RIFCSPHIGHO2_02_FULL_43_12 TaxID=1797776 RepID=A0A1F5KIW2_9BACT|nr:MAG: arginine--tRNA ligase [Candidatus Daviesbacteria bacterium RIFCSPHIGHO2_01_FULL_44_29]OGE40425.1 MAG: arginine--tRNA ligase [Candidatus Daviesbacteria bacterium RIFCSPHIGHO2_12_FULL_47_45]OGE40735.1 MAG: arginine--tRNA ligase [Candidatus Daviesbacteria bacterium RIFCSPHIGHO2_02_FULL_43_12]OGE69768.1 MAG: arginine--tRNA ligase [Candidatus Daviesbacteria bacterium RIFCSPLOWO2_01_FULL_43_15]
MQQNFLPTDPFAEKVVDSIYDKLKTTMIYLQLEQDLQKAVEKLGFSAKKIELSFPENSKFGDFSTNIALQLSNQDAGKRYQSPKEIANAISQEFTVHGSRYVDRVEVAGPGFINFFIKDQILRSGMVDDKRQIKDSRGHKLKYFVEYAGPNLSKEFHIGHLRNLIFGEALARFLENAGHEVYRATYSSDIGLPLAKTLWGVINLQDQFEEAKQKSLVERLKFLGLAYVHANSAYEEDPAKKTEIDTLNKKIYQRSLEYVELWKLVTNWSLEYLKTLYTRMGTSFDNSFLESEVEKRGKEIVLQNVGRVFEESQGAVIFPGEKYGLHSRVFITSAGNPTYEAKEVGLAFAEEQAFPFDIALHIVGSEQSGYFEVVLKAIELVDERFKGRKKHLSYGLVSLTTGKMSSRKGNVVTAEQLLEMVKAKVADLTSIKGEDGEKIVEQVTVGAVKFYMLKFASSTDISFDIDKSVSLEGDSGPYVQYTYARAQSVLRNQSQGSKVKGQEKLEGIDLQEEEREVLRLLTYYPLIVQKASQELSSTTLCFYLLDLAKSFNLFYQRCPILKSDKEAFRLELTERVTDTIKSGLYLLGIEAPERM